MHLLGDLLDHVRDRCVTSPALLFSLIATNLAIAAAYLHIPRRLQRIRRRVGGRITAYGEVKLVAIFVASCGFTHLFSVAVLFFPALDWWAIGWASWTAIISWWTARVIAQGEELYVSSILGARTLIDRLEAHEEPA